MKKLFLVILLFSASCVFSQGVKRGVDLLVGIHNILPRQVVTVSLLSNDTLVIGESSPAEENAFFEYSSIDLFKTPGIYTLSTKIFDSYTLRSKTECRILDIKENARRIDVYIDFNTGYGKKKKRSFSCDTRIYYTSLDSVILEEKWTPESKGFAEYIIRNNSQNTIYANYFVDMLSGSIERMKSGTWFQYFRGGGVCGYYKLDVPIKPGSSSIAGESAFPSDLKPFSKGKYRFVVTYFTKDDTGNRKNYILEKEFKIKDD